MAKSELGGHYKHETLTGVSIYIWKREQKFLARFRYNNVQTAETLAADPVAAGARLRGIMVEIEQGTYVPAWELRKRPFKHARPPQQTLRKIFDAYLDDVRSRKGHKTYRNYLNRSIPILEFAELAAVVRRFRYAEDINRQFAVECRAAIFKRQVARNGQVATSPTRISPGHVCNIMLFASTALNWARRPDVNHLPLTFANPFTSDIIGKRPRRDPIALLSLPVSLRIEMVQAMDRYQLCLLAPMFVLPPRPEDFAGLMIGDIQWDAKRVIFGARMDGDDHNKTHVSYHVPFPETLKPLLEFCTKDRKAGPVFLRRAVIDGKRYSRIHATSAQEIEARFEDLLVQAKQPVRNQNDRKCVFRQLLCRLGGISQGQLANEFKKVLALVRPSLKMRCYELRASITTDLLTARIDEDLRQYFTGHSTDRKILARYQSLDPNHLLAPYFDYIRPLLEAISQRWRELGMLGVGGQISTVDGAAGIDQSKDC
ncbi:MAG TPA: hypothetical protein VFE58_07920 [Tepidisphaeraceae bacterium]|nr:hypothetical protein [Tepidisphaeraceae bacterium]